MNDSPFVLVALSATAVMLLVSFSIEVGVKALARHREQATERVRLSMLELFLFLDPHLLWVSAAIFCVAVVLATLMATHSPAAALLSGAGAAALPAVVIRLLRRRRRRMLQEQFPDALLMLSGALRAGCSLSTAMHQIGPELPAPVSQEIGLVLREQRLGVSLDAALEGFSLRASVPSVSLAVAAMRIAHDSGGGLAEALERAAATLRSQLAIESKIRALTSQGKLQALIVGALPVLLAVILLRMEPAEMSLLFVTRAGMAALAVIVILEALGVYVIRRIVMIDV